MGRLMHKGVDYSGTGGDNSRTMSYESYQNLSEAEKLSDTTFYIPDYPGLDCVLKSDVVDNLESTATDLPLSANMGRELKVKSKYVKAQLTTSIYGYYYFDETTKIYRGETKIPIPDDATEVLGVMAGACYALTGNVNVHYPFECAYFNGEIVCTAYSPTSQTVEFGVTIIYR